MDPDGRASHDPDRLSQSPPNHWDRFWRTEPWLAGSTPPFMYVIGGIVVLILVGIGVLMQFGISLWESPGLRFTVRAPAGTPAWLVNVDGYWGPRREFHNSVWARQTWCTVPEARSLSIEGVRAQVEGLYQDFYEKVKLACVEYWQTPYTLQIATEGKTPVTVDGVQGWLWPLSQDAFLVDRGEAETRLSGDPSLLQSALTEAFESPRDAFERAGIYYKIREERREPWGIVYGPALMLQWNKDGQHFVLIGENQRPVTDELLVDMGNSMVPAEQLRPTAMPQI